MITENQNTSGQGSGAAIPDEVKGWSWGAFLLGWIWGIGNNTYRSFIMFIPIVGIVMWIMLGIYGRQWAWQNKRWSSIEEFNKVQRKWSTVAVVWVIVVFLFGVISSAMH